ncbi:MAG: HAD family hydrolase, partial [Dehalococcoidia bacterium]
MNKLIMQKLIACITLSAFLIQGPGIAGQLSTQYALRPMAAAIDARLGAENALSQTDYTLLAGTRYVRVIRDRSDLYSNNAISIAIIDWDETISLIKKGWQAAMATFVAKIWASGNTQEPGYAWGSGIKPTQDDYEYAHEFVKRTIGTLTRVQYATVIYLKKYRLKNGGIDREAFERALDGILNMSQDDFILPPGSSHPLWGSSGGELWEKAGACYASWKRIMGSEFRDARLKQIRDNISQPDEFLVPYAIDLIRGLHDRGVKLYALSGSGEDQVREEAELLGVKDYFEIIFGYAGTMEEQTGKAYSKSEATKYVLYQLEGIPLGEEHKALLIGDGPSEMDTGRSLGCTTLGLVPGHVSEPDKRNQLFATLKKAGGDYIIVADEGKDFSDWHVLVDFFCSWKASSAGTLPDSIKHLAETGHTPTSLDISTYKKSPYYTLPDGWELEVYPDIDDTGTVFAVKMIRAIQHWQYDMEFLKKHQKVIMQTCTGDTPWLGYKKFIDLYRTWETRDTQAILRRLGINPDLKPDMSMIDMVALDAIFPQKRDAYHAFANILTGFYDPLGIPDENRHFFYGDLIFDNEAGVSRRMTEEEYNNLLSEIDDKGFRLDEFLIGYQRWRAPDMQMFANKYPLQFLHFQALLFHAREMSNFLQGNGGAHIYLYGLGPSDFAEGHIGFNEAHTPINSNAFIASIVYHIASAHAKELGRGGMGDLVDKVRMSEQRFKEFVYKYGRITFSYNDFVKRDDAVNIIISTNNSKSSSNARGVEGPRAP